MTAKLWIDTETFSPVPIKNGTHAYAEQAEVMLFAWALDDGPVSVWDVTADSANPPAELVAALADQDVEVWAHNTAFDRTVMRWALPDLTPPVERWRDTMVQAYAHSLPGSLGQLCEILGVPLADAKDKEGKALVRLFCMPNPLGQKVERATRETHPEQWAKFIAYAGQDIVAMRECHRRMPTWNYPGHAGERTLWHLDQRVNDRGMAIDMDLARAAVAAVAKAQKGLAARTADLTDGEVQTATQGAALIEHILAAYGVSLPDMRKSTIERRVNDPDLPLALRDLLAVRLQTATTSTAKYQALIRGTSWDNRMRGTAQFCGAGRTGRWAHRLVQPGNMARPTMRQADIDMGIEALKADCADLLYGNVMQLVSNTVRGAIVAPEGKKLVAADLSNIEGRDQAWLAGEDWKLQAFREFDTCKSYTGSTWLDGDTIKAETLLRKPVLLDEDDKGEPIRKGPDLYKLAYGKSFGLDPKDVTKDQRQVGKVQELALGYEGGVGAFVTFATAYKIDLEELPAKVFDVANPDLVAEARDFLAWTLGQKRKNPTMGLSDDAFVACDTLKRAWRRAHPNIAQMWADLKFTVMQAIDSPGRTYTLRALKIRRDGAWLRIVLPSGRALCYPSPRIDDGTITYMGIDQYTRKWSRLKTYGGKLFENCIASGTPVLTRSGWIAIEHVTALHEVWDGVEWVKHQGCTYRGKQKVMSSFGVRMTPDHRVLTTEGWINASQSEGHQRAACRVPDGYPVPGFQRPEILVDSAVRLRGRDHPGRDRTGQAGSAGHHGIVRVQTQRDHWAQGHAPRHGTTPGLRGVGLDAGALFQPATQGVQELRGAWDHGVRSVARFVRRLLGGHGADVQAGADAGAQRERTGVWPRELHLADTEGAGEQHAHRAQARDTAGGDERTGGRRSIRREAQHLALSTAPRVAPLEGFEPVYDLIDCGPRHRFVVLGDDGAPLIVHNCCQAVARDVMAANMPRIEAEGYEIVLTVHDEVVTETPAVDSHYPEHLAALLATNPTWAPGMPLAAAGFESPRYRKD
jgi:DNA polymerase